MALGLVLLKRFSHILSFKHIHSSEMKLPLAFVLLSIIFVKASEKARFDNYRVYEIYIENDQQLELLQQIDSFPDGVRNRIFQIETDLKLSL